MPSFTFQTGDHSLKDKRGHCVACSAVQATLVVQADDIDQAVERANQILSGVTRRDDPTRGNTWSLNVTFRPITKRQHRPGVLA
jgi:hypothetical protein